MINILKEQIEKVSIKDEVREQILATVLDLESIGYHNVFGAPGTFYCKNKKLEEIHLTSDGWVMKTEDTEKGVQNISFTNEELKILDKHGWEIDDISHPGVNIRDWFWDEE